MQVKLNCSWYVNNLEKNKLEWTGIGNHKIVIRKTEFLAMGDEAQDEYTSSACDQVKWLWEFHWALE